MAEEIEIYQNDDVRITSLRAIFGVKTYPIANIASVGGEKIPAKSGGPGLFFVVGFIFLILGTIGEGTNWTSVLVGAVLAAIGLYAGFTTKPTYAVILVTSSGEARAWTS